MAASARKRRHRGQRLEDQVDIVEEGKVRRAVTAAGIGNMMEWFDFGVFSYLVVITGKVFFPAGNPTVQLLSTFATFAVAFIVRPLGGFVFGPLGDRLGRKRVLAITMIMMALGTVAIGFIPSYATIGIWAPILLLVARVVQGFSTGGEYGGATTFVSEYAPDKRRGFLASWLEFGTLTGYALGAAVVTILLTTLGEQEMVNWGWRIPFLLAGPLGVIGLYLRFRLEETPAQQQAESSADGEADSGLGIYRTIFRDHWRPVLTCVSLVAVFNVANYMLTAYIPTYITADLHYAHTSALVFVLVTMLVIMGFVVRLGRISDKIGRLPIVAAGAGALVVLSWPAFWMISRGAVWAVIGGLIILGLMLICFSSTMPSTLPALFPTHVRYGGVSISYNISVAVFGGTTPLLSEYLVSTTGNTTAPAFVLIAAGLLGLIASWFARETAGRPLPGAKPTAGSREEARETLAEQRGEVDGTT
ncbi:MFS transporter [Saccharopolyspora sp. NFXS83]|uniref:MFS transporter n=1 Tax=Saccharopolyspora sp. NFXS83 TaxID=2993560 RepID=UPI00224AD74C|nr:MFS transporter [Saccharopolyspora sp. NFXS83]MCX2733497.1 MFS transporter [Saccharopolyspora sp. NFXS83]